MVVPRSPVNVLMGAKGSDWTAELSRIGAGASAWAAPRAPPSARFFEPRAKCESTARSRSPTTPSRDITGISRHDQTQSRSGNRE